MTELEVIKYIENHAYISDEVKDIAIKALKNQINAKNSSDGFFKNLSKLKASNDRLRQVAERLEQIVVMADPENEE